MSDRIEPPFSYPDECDHPRRDQEMICSTCGVMLHDTANAIGPPSDSSEDIDAFLDTLDFRTIQRAWDRKSARLRNVKMPPADDDDA